MRLIQRLAIVAVTLLTTLAVAIPAQTAEAVGRPVPTPPTPPQVVAVQPMPESALEPNAASELQRIRFIRRNHLLDVYDQRIYFAKYRVYRFTWTGTWRLKNNWDRSGDERAFISSVCSLLWKFPVAGASCGIGIAGVYYLLGKLINRAIRHKKCVVLARKHRTIFGPGAAQPVVWAGTARCWR